MKKTLHIDAFIYDDDEINCLEDEGKLSRCFCQDCGSNSIEQYGIIKYIGFSLTVALSVLPS